MEPSLEPQIKFHAGEQLLFSARLTQGRSRGSGQEGPNETENWSPPSALRPREKPSEPGLGHEKIEGARVGVGVGGTIPFVQTLVLRVKNNRLGDKIVLSLTLAILGMLIFKSQN